MVKKILCQGYLWRIKGRKQAGFAAYFGLIRPKKNKSAGIKPKTTLAKTVLRNASKISIIFS